MSKENPDPKVSGRERSGHLCIRPKDHERIKRIANAARRSIIEHMGVILDEYEAAHPGWEEEGAHSGIAP